MSSTFYQPQLGNPRIIIAAPEPAKRPAHTISIPDCPNPCAKPGAPNCTCAANAFPLPTEQTLQNEMATAVVNGDRARYETAAQQLSEPANDCGVSPCCVCEPDTLCDNTTCTLCARKRLVQPQPPQQNQQQPITSIGIHLSFTDEPPAPPPMECPTCYAPTPHHWPNCPNDDRDELGADKAQREAGYYRSGPGGYTTA